MDRKIHIPKHKTVLIVDDSLIVRRMVRFALQGVDYKLLEASDGAEAVRVLYSQVVDLLITDLNMPNLDGFELSRIVRETIEMKDLPIIMLTNEDSPACKEKARQSGVSLFISKPFNPEQIFGLVKEVLG